MTALVVVPAHETGENLLARLILRLVLLPELLLDLKLSRGRDGVSVLLEAVLTAAHLLQDGTLDRMQGHPRGRSAEVDDTETFMHALVRGRDGDLEGGTVSALEPRTWPDNDLPCGSST